MNFLKGLLLTAGLCVFAQAASAETLDYNKRFTPLYSCGGQATLAFVGAEAYLRVDATSQCHFVAVPGRGTLPIDPAGYLLSRNTRYEVIVTSRTGKHLDRLWVDTHVPHLPPPLPPVPRPHPAPSRFPAVSVVANGIAVPLPSCGGFVSLRQSMVLGRPLLTFSDVKNCTYYQVLRADSPVMIDEARARLSGAPGHYYLVDQEVPSRWIGFQSVIVRLQSASGAHGADVVVRFER